jgi:hypothetical protein
VRRRGARGRRLKRPLLFVALAPVSQRAAGCAPSPCRSRCRTQARSPRHPPPSWKTQGAAGEHRQARKTVTTGTCSGPPPVPTEAAPVARDRSRVAVPQQAARPPGAWGRGAGTRASRSLLPGHRGSQRTWRAAARGGAATAERRATRGQPSASQQAEQQGLAPRPTAAKQPGPCPPRPEQPGVSLPQVHRRRTLQMLSSAPGEGRQVSEGEKGVEKCETVRPRRPFSHRARQGLGGRQTHALGGRQTHARRSRVSSLGKGENRECALL